MYQIRGVPQCDVRPARCGPHPGHRGYWRQRPGITPARPGIGAGMTETVQTRGDGHDEILALDTSGDGQPDLWAIDTDGDGKADLFQSDTDGDGQPDVTMVDLTQDGEMDIIVDGDGGHPVE
ncbi:hypothetical protein GCM10028775_43940 [Catellatospora paridis]